MIDTSKKSPQLPPIARVQSCVIQSPSVLSQLGFGSAPDSIKQLRRSPGVNKSQALTAQGIDWFRDRFLDFVRRSHAGAFRLCFFIYVVLPL
jgi:hypothetical protein